MTIFTMKGGKIEPIAIIKGGKTITYEDFMQMATAAIAAAGGSGEGRRARRRRRPSATPPRSDRAVARSARRELGSSPKKSRPRAGLSLSSGRPC